MKTHSFRLFPTSEQQQELRSLYRASGEIWNHFVGAQNARIAAGEPAWTAFDMHKLLTQERKGKPQWQKLNSKACQRMTSAVDFAFRSYSALLRKDKTARSPQAMEIEGFRSLTFNQSGWSFKNGLVFINKLPLSYKSHLPVHEMHIKELRVKLRNGKWLCDVCVEDAIKESAPIPPKAMAIDMGLSKLATAVSSDGKVIFLPNKAKKISTYYTRIIGELQQRQATAQKGSRRWRRLKKRVGDFHYKKQQQIKHALHAQSKRLLGMDHGTIVVGDIQVKKLMGQEKNKNRKVSRSFGRSALSMFMDFLAYKAIAKGVNVIRVNEWNTTQINCLTGKLFDKKVELGDRSVVLKEGLAIDRDLNSAINIYKRWHENHIAAVAPPPGAFVPGVLERNNLLKEPIPSLEGSQRV